ncbi:VOC family protein [Limimaricola pyoseonensis]|uniref:Catechol 2,3-dioxygenase n=1 Tax=Limimaricola pyoseonensis TaxID=521013 RepID=A0A1G7HHA3_9RHOB|nr:VOC family protein [Limimaricola pyoseonensis]SDE99768.1 Catechol 2,3-dioxygenase [Limimaricola pyoseonensis]
MRMTAPMEAGLAVRDLDRMLAFYREAFGFETVADVHVPAEKARAAALSRGGYRVVRLQTPRGERIKLLAPDTPPAARPEPTEMILDRADGAYLTFIVDDLGDVVARAVAAGARPMTGDDPVEVRPGTYLAFLRDPEGHVFEIVQYADIAAYRPDLAGPAA